VDGRHGLRLTTRTRIEVTLKVQVLLKFGTTLLARIPTQWSRSWVAEMLSSGPSPATVGRQSSRFGVPRCGDCRQPAGDQSGDQRATAIGAIEAAALPLPDRGGVAGRGGAGPVQGLVLVGASAWGEAAGLTRASIDVPLSRMRVTTHSCRSPRPRDAGKRAGDHPIQADGPGR
jgi:hypothetical protein